jgi:mannose-1-phosphate guanylyltransferase
MWRANQYVQTMPAAFILGAGLGTRLRPLTNRLPKPLVPVAHRPLIEHAFDHLRRGCGADRFVVNTHHLAEAYAAAYATGTWESLPLRFRHEPVLLDTGGGLANVADLLPAGESVVLCNGDVLTDLPLRPAWEHHLESGAEATLVLRSTGPLCNVAFVADGAVAGCPAGRVLDLRGLRGASGQLTQFTGICFAAPALRRQLPPAGTIFSLIPFLVERIAAGAAIRGVVADAGLWSDLGTPAALLAAHDQLLRLPFPADAPQPTQPIHPAARVAPGTCDARTWVGPGAVVPAGCRVAASVLFAGAQIAAGVNVERCLVGPGAQVGQSAREAVIV